MSRLEKQKLKLLYLLKILTEQTDEQHPMPMPVLLEKLRAEDINAERKSIYRDIDCLMEFGADIAYDSTRGSGGYYLASREFELPELKLRIVDVLRRAAFFEEAAAFAGQLKFRTEQYIKIQEFQIARAKAGDKKCYKLEDI